MDLLENCRLCPRNCGINRHFKIGVCGASDKIKLAYYGLYKWEEPVISGKNGSGSVFFSHCNLKCIFCQNKKISLDGYGKEISEDRLKEIFLELQEKNAHNINLVTPTHYVPQIKTVLEKIKNKELIIPIVYNTSSYENVSTIKLMDGLVDVYLADLKYYDNTLGLNYSNCNKYFEVASSSISEMYNQVGKPIIKNGIMIKGVIVRILILPEEIDDAKHLLKYLWDTYGDNIIISIMNQYTPMECNYPFNNLNRSLSDAEYDDVINYACDLGITKAFIQEGGTVSESFIPNFDIEKI